MNKLNKNEWIVTIVIVLGAVLLISNWVNPSKSSLDGFDDAAYEADLRNEMR